MFKIFETIKEQIINTLSHREIYTIYNQDDDIDFFRKVNQVHNQYEQRYPDLKNIDEIFSQVQFATNVNDFQTKLNLAAYLIKTDYGKRLLNYINRQCEVPQKYELYRQWEKQSDNTINLLLLKYQDVYPSKPIQTFWNQILPELNQSLDELSKESDFQTQSKFINTYQNRIEQIKQFNNEQLSQKLLQTGYKPTLIEIANDDFVDDNHMGNLWNQQLQITFDNLKDYRMQLMLIAFNMDLVLFYNQIMRNKGYINEIDTFQINHQLLKSIKQSNQLTPKDTQKITKRFDTVYQSYQNQRKFNQQNGDDPDWGLDGLNDTYDNANRMLKMDIETYLIDKG